MAGATHGERIAALEKKAAELDKFDAVLTIRLDAVAGEVGAVTDGHTETARAVADLRREHEREIALLKREVEELKKARDQTWQRVWMIVGPIISGIIVAAAAYQFGFKK